jgi:hypothetical protein
MSSTNNNTAAAEDRLPLYQKRKPHANTVPPLRKSLSRNTMLYNNNPNNPSPTRPLFHGNKIDQQQRQLTAEAAVFPEHPTPLFHPPQQPQDYHTITKRSSSTPLSIQVFKMPIFIYILCTLFT